MTKLRESIKNKKIYGNYSVFSPENILMFRSNLKKINWYLKRNLAEKIDDHSIKLKFKPNGLGCHNLGYGLDKMKNLCVVCGNDQFLTKHHVVPKCYRMHFPEEIKSHCFHDVLTVCWDCHYKYEKLAFLFKKEIANEYNSPIDGDLINNKTTQKIKGLFLCLSDKSIPKSRIRSIKSEIKKELGIKRITKKMNNHWINIKPDKPIICIRTNGEMVVQKIKNIKEFIKRWRSHFVESTKPKFLPENWSIDYE